MTQDNAWKDILEALFPEFLEFFFPQVHRDVDFERGFQFLDKELQKILKDSEVGKRIVDKLVKVYLRDGKEKWLLIHIEVQGQPEKEFAQRIYIYNYRIFDKFRKEVISLAILTDTVAHFRPAAYRVSRWGFEYSFRFPVVKLIDYVERWDELAAHPNPFARVVRAFLKTQETQGDDQERYGWKKAFLLELYQGGFTRQSIIALYRFIDWIMMLPKELEDAIFQEVKKAGEKESMPYISTAERIGRQEGIKEGRRKGLLEGLLESIYDILEIKFGEEGLLLFPAVKNVREIDSLQTIRRGLKKAQTIAEAQAVIEAQLAEGE